MPPQFLVVFPLTPPQMGLSCCLTMATIVPKTIRGHRYYYLVQTAWVNGRSRYVKQLYLGKAEDIGKLFEEATAPVPTQGLPFEFGGTAALYSVAQQLQLAEIIDCHVPKRNQGVLPYGESLVSFGDVAVDDLGELELLGHRIKGSGSSKLEREALGGHRGGGLLEQFADVLSLAEVELFDVAGAAVHPSGLDQVIVAVAADGLGDDGRHC